MIDIPFDLFNDKMNASTLIGLLYGYEDENDLEIVGDIPVESERDKAIAVAEFLNELEVVEYLKQLK